MSYPSALTLSNLNERFLNSKILWPSYLGQTFGVIPFQEMKASTNEYSFNLASSLAALSPSLKGSTLGQNPVNTTKVQEPFQRFGDSQILDYFEVISGREVEQLYEQARAVEARILRKLAQQFYEGSGVAPQLASLKQRASEQIWASGVPLSLELLYRTKYLVKPSEEEGRGFGGNVWLSHPKAFQKLLSLLGSQVSAIENVYVEELGVSLPVFLGMPWCVDDEIQITVANNTHIYAVNRDHLRILYGSNERFQANERGIQCIPIPMQKNKSELGVMVFASYAIQNDPGAIAWLRLVNIA
jgi:hypothetical protein